MTTSFQYAFTVPAAGDDTRDIVSISIDFNPVYAANPGQKPYLEFVNLAGIRQNTLGAVEIIEAFSSRLIGNFESDNLPTATIDSPRPGDRIGRFQGIVFSNNFPFKVSENSGIIIPPIFKLEFNPSNIVGKSVGDVIIVSFTFGFRVI